MQRVYFWSEGHITFLELINIRDVTDGQGRNCGPGFAFSCYLTCVEFKTVVYLRWLSALLILPGTALIVIPLLLWLLSREMGLEFDIANVQSLRFITAIFAFLPGATLSIWAVVLFVKFGGEGTPAPWDPPTKLVVRGPYRHVRNPMICGVIGMLVGMALFFGSILLGAWALVFFVGNHVYFAQSEEPELRERFGKDYEVYCTWVRRWIPRLTPWNFE